MTARTRRWIRRAFVFAAAVVLSAATARAQSTAINGTIEGTIKDASGGLLPGVTVTVNNTDTGAERIVVTDSNGIYRATLLPLGSYQITAELGGFKKLQQTQIPITAGTTAVINMTMEVGGITEVVSVQSDAAVVDLGKIDVGRNLNEREIHNLPLVSRNPYNFALLQPGVSGFENSEFGVPRFSANGSLLRINYQMDGNTNTQKDRAGIRLMPMSEVAIGEVKVTTSGYAPEFGQTMGLVYNAITPSGTNKLRGDVSYRFRRTPFAAYPFFSTINPRSAANKPKDVVNTVTASSGGPIVQNKVHYYAGFERTYRDMTGTFNLDPALVAQVGQPAQPNTVPAYQSVRFFLGKIDYQLAQGHRLTTRVNWFENNNPYNGGAGGTTTIERGFDYKDAMSSTAAQLVSNWGGNRLNELRTQYARRHFNRQSHAGGPEGISVTITNAISFGHPTSDGEDFVQGLTQILDNFTFNRGRHSFKQGFDFQLVQDTRAVPLTSIYTFPTVAAYLAAKAGTNPFGYTTFAQVIGDPNFKMTSKLFSAFWQDDWRLTPDLKLLYGFRYDAYFYPKANPNAPFSYSQKYRERHEQLRAPRRPRLDARREEGPGRARQHRHHVRPAAAGGLRERDPAERPAGAQDLLGRRHRDRRSGLSEHALQPAGRGGAAGAVDLRAGSGSEAGLQHPEQRPVRARVRQVVQHFRWRGLQPRLQPAGDQRHQPDQPGRDARRRPSDLRHRRQPRHAHGSALQPHHRGAVPRRVDLQGADADVRQTVIRAACSTT